MKNKGSIHPSAQEIIKSGVFDNIDSFIQLKKRISAIRDKNEEAQSKKQGDVFEIFCEGYLTLESRFQTRKVYPQAVTPLEIQKKLNLPSYDDGWDGVYETMDGRFATYQAKFRTKNTRLEWGGKGGLSTTAARGQQADIIHLITTVTIETESFTRDPKVIQTLGNDLEPIDKNIFLKIEKWLKQTPITEEYIHTPEKYQQEALDNIKEELDTKDRATIVMACGSGKTDIGIWEYIRRKPRLALVLVPSIALIKQTRGDWLSQIQNNVMTFQLCSSKDNSKREDALIIKEKDIDFKISTNEEVLKKWLEKKTSIPKIIFSTYQSSPILNKLSQKHIIDFAVFDEAHRTATLNQKAESYFSNALFDKNIKIKKRLFMTATRRIGSKRRNKEGDEKLSINMDNKELYGNVCHKLSFSKAATYPKGIAKLKIIVSEIFSDEIDNERTKISSTHVNGEKLKSDYLANIIAIKKAVKKHKINKVFTFHSQISHAQNFTTTEGPENIGYYLKDFYTNYIKGEMRVTLRDAIMSEFKNSPKGLIANKRCLIEGVNVPEVGMVVITSPKESEVDIVQAIGRALRKRHDITKKFGYILVPILIERNRNEKYQDALKRTNFEKLVHIINAIKYQDDEIAQIINEINQSQKRGKGFTIKARNKLNEFIESSHPEISQKLLTEVIETNIVNRLSTTWDEKISELLSIKDELGDVDKIFESNDKKYINIKLWLQLIRRRWAVGNLLDFQIKQLNDIGLKQEREIIKVKDFENNETINNAAKRLNLGINYIKKLIDMELIEDLGFGRNLTGQPTTYIKYYSEKDLMKIANLEILDTKGLFSIYHLVRKLGIGDDKYINKYFETLKIKGLRGPTTGGGRTKETTFMHYYPDIDIENFKKVLKFTHTTNQIKSKKLIAEINFKKIVYPRTPNFGYTLIEYLIREKKLKVEAISIQQTRYFKKHTKKQLKKYFGYDYFKLRKLPEISKVLKLSEGLLRKYFDKKKIKPLFNTGEKGHKWYLLDFNSKHVFNELGINVFDLKGKLTLPKLSKKLGVSESVIKRLIERNKMKPAIGNAVTSGGIHPVFNDISKKDFKKIYKI